MKPPLSPFQKTLIAKVIRNIESSYQATDQKASELFWRAACWSAQSVMIR